MKKFPYSLTVTFVAAVIIVAMPNVAPAAGQPWPQSTNAGVGKDQMLLAQAETADQKKTRTDKKRPLANVDKNGVILKGYDAVAYFKQSQAVKGDPKYSSRYGSATYYFASAEDKAEFDKAPAEYTPRYGGFCANSMSKHKLNDIDPTQFLIYKGKLYVCTGPPELKEFSAKPDANIKAADKSWDIWDVYPGVGD